jgi:hypothetical protein
MSIVTSDWRKKLGQRLAILQARSVPRLIPDHRDRDAVKEQAEADFLGLYHSMGGTTTDSTRLRCVFHKDNNPSAEIWQGKYHCWSCDVRLNPFEFVMQVQEIGFKQALDWLAHRYGVPLGGKQLTVAERIAIEAQERAAEKEAKALVDWKEDRLFALRLRRDRQLGIYHRGLRLILKHSLLHPFAHFWADITIAYEAKYRATDKRIARLKDTSYADLLPAFRARRHA